MSVHTGDAWHRAMINYSQAERRFMLKFYFVRLEEPWMTGPTWSHEDAAWRPVDGQHDDDAAEATWRWLLGQAPVDAADADVPPNIAALAEDSDAPEQERVRAIMDCAASVAAHDRGTGRNPVAEELVGTLGSNASCAVVSGIIDEGWEHSTSDERGPRRQSKAANPVGTNPADLDAMHALCAAGAAALPTLLQVLCAPRHSFAAWWVRAAAAAAIGSLGPAVATSGTAEALAEAMREDSELWVRRNCAESLGYALAADAPTATAELVVRALVGGLRETDLVEAAYPAEAAADARRGWEEARRKSEVRAETVRCAAVTALARVAPHPCVGPAAARAVHEVLTTPTTHRLNHTTRYFAAVALRRMATEESTSLLLSALMTSRWQEQHFETADFQ